MSTSIPITDIAGLPSPVGNPGLFLQSNGSVYVLVAGSGGGGGTWGSITGTLSNQTDLQTALNARVLTSTTVNGHALSGNVVVTPGDLSLVIGTNVQAWSANLDTWSTKTPFSGTLSITSGKTFTVTNTLSLSGTDSSTLNIGSGGTLGTNAYSSTAYVPQTTTVNGHALSSNVTVTPTDLSLVIGTNVEAWSANLDTWSTKTPYSGSVAVTSGKTFTANNTLTLSGTDGSTLNVGSGGTLGTNAYTSTAYVPQTTTVNGHALSGNVTVTPSDLSLVIGTNVEAWSANLDTWSGKTPYAGSVVVTTGKTFTSNNTLTLSGTDASTLNIGTGGTLGTAAYTASSAYQSAATNLTSLAGLSYASLSFVKMSASGTFSLDTSVYLTANQTITLSGNISGSGTTAITTTIGAGVVTLSMLANETAYTLLGNATSSSAAPTALSSGIYLGTGSLPYTDTGVGHYQWGSVTGYFQQLLLNTSNGTSASSDFIVGNNLSTATAYYGDLGQNSSTFTGSGSLSLANAVYLYSQNGDLVLGTNSSNAIHLVVNNGATDALTVSSSGAFTFPAFSTAGILTNSASGLLATVTNASSVTSALMNVLGSGWSNSTSLFLRGDGTWATPSGGGNVSNSGTPTNGQLAGWTGATTIQGITLGTNLSLAGTTLNAAGGSGSPAGSSSWVQYNASGAFGANSAFTSDTSGNVAVASLAIANGVTTSTTTSSTSYQLLATDFDVAFTGSSPATFTMLASPSAGRWYRVTNMGSAVLTLSSTNNFFTSIAGNSTFTMNPGDSVDVVYINSTWKVQ